MLENVSRDTLATEVRVTGRHALGISLGTLEVALLGCPAGLPRVWCCQLLPGSAAEVLIEEAQISSGSVRRGSSARGLLAIAGALGAGEVGREIAEALTEFTTPECEEEPLGLARHWSIS